MSDSARLQLLIASDWTGAPIAPAEVSTIGLRWTPDLLHLTIEAPYAGDPPPPGEARSLDGLWEYEVVELFLVEERSLGSEPRYVEIEVSPHGHHLLLGFEGVRQRTAIHEPLSCRVTVSGGRWRGDVVVDSRILPDPPLRANAFRVHGSGASRRHLAAHPAPGDRPDFHRVDLFPVLG